MVIEQTCADKWVLAGIHNRALFREIAANVRKYGSMPLTNNALTPGMDVIWLWYCTPQCSPVPIRAIVLQVKNGKTQIRAQFESGPIVLWAHARRLRTL
jgi:hypothetical protein